MNKAYTEAELDELIEHSVEHQGAQRASVIPILNEINDLREICLTDDSRWLSMDCRLEGL